jgi:glycosyltransferase involved in cell wall biosynthesis
MKILYAITKGTWGGAQRYVYDLATEAARAGYAVGVAYGTPGELADRLKETPVTHFPLYRLARDVRLGNDVSSFRQLLHILKIFRPDVLHVNSSKMGALGALAGRLSGVRHIVFTAHAWAFNERRPWYQKLIIASIAWVTILLSTRTIVVSYAMQSQISGWPWTKRKVSVVHNGTREYSLLERAAARQALATYSPVLSSTDLVSGLWIGTIAELHPVKGLFDALAAMKKLRETHPTVRYVIIGDGELRAKLEKEVRNLSLSSSVFLLGNIPDAARYARALDVFLLPSHSEAFGVVLLEAGLASLPVVATRVGGISEILSEGETGRLVPPRSPEALAKALASLLDQETTRRALGERLYNVVQEQFSLEQCVRKTFALYS